MPRVLNNGPGHSATRITHWVVLLVTSLHFGQAVRADVVWEGGVTAVYQYADDSRSDAELTVSADLFARVARRRGEWLVYVEGSTTPDDDGVSAFYPTANADAGSGLIDDGDGGIQISGSTTICIRPTVGA